MQEIRIETKTGKEIISLTLNEFMDLETGIIAMFLNAHQIYSAQGRLSRTIHEYERRYVR